MASRAAAPAKRSTTVAARASAPRKSRGKRPAPAPLRESEGRLGLRRPPSQGRGLVTFERVLATATELLDRVGAEGLTTNLIASESGVNISSIYKYFPNKHAILVALFERYNQQRFEAVRELVETFGGSPDWEHTLDKTIDKILSTRRATPGNVALRRAMRSSPELAEIDQQANQSVARWFSEQVRQLTGLPERRAIVVSRLAIEAETALMDWWESPDVDYAPMVAREIKAMMRAYIGLYAPPSAPAKA
ncbi:MAG: TetR/AcrR family transcriptional regulator [Rhodoferax sp.]|jgi:AcrR family transcriptional regulator|nr:TetR/AcrR family transcriptional regulator [Rhodoferax sp.]